MIRSSTDPLTVMCDSSSAADFGNFLVKSASNSGENANESAACGLLSISLLSAAARCAITVAAWLRSS